MLKKCWVELKDKKTKQLIRIIYNPYNASIKSVIADWIIPEERKNVYGVKTSQAVTEYQRLFNTNRGVKNENVPGKM